jgi:hypothetical protein
MDTFNYLYKVLTDEVHGLTFVDIRSEILMELQDETYKLLLGGIRTDFNYTELNNSSFFDFNQIK